VEKMKTVFLMRHAKATPGKPADPKRLLTTRGHRNAATMASFLEDLDKKPEAILCSPFKRTLQTAQAIKTKLNLPLATSKNLEPDANLRAALNDIKAEPVDCLLVVTHEPLLSDIGMSLLGLGDVRFAPILFKQGSIARIDMESYGNVLRWIVTPKLIGELVR
jgi:phosphohistidine phosphatase